MGYGRLLSLAAAVVCVGAAACRTTSPKETVSGYELDAQHWSEVKEELSRRASFELSCPATDLEFTVVKDGEGVMGADDDEATQVGVRGCNRQVLYLRIGPTLWVTQSAAKAD